MRDATTIGQEHQEAVLSGICPYCSKTVDVLFDVKGRPYWRCSRCDLRTFGSRSALAVLVEAGWIWAGQRPTARLHTCLTKLIEALEPHEASDL